MTEEKKATIVINCQMDTKNKAVKMANKQNKKLHLFLSELIEKEWLKQQKEDK